MKKNKTKKVNVTIVFPPRASSQQDLDLVRLTKQIVKKTMNGESSGYGLGGKNGYGEEFENDVFMMHPYCWCEQKECRWCFGDEPNFRHKKSGLEIKWYKWIGRDMTLNKKVSPVEWKKIIKECIKSV